MKRNHKYLKRKVFSKRSKIVLVALCILALLAVITAVVLMLSGRSNDNIAADNTVPSETTIAPSETTEATTEPTIEETTEPVETEPQMLPRMAELYEKNPDIVGWITIPDTVLDYPVMFTPEDPEEYLYKNYDQIWSVGGSPFIDGACSMDPESTNLIIYAHNMNNGSMFHTLMSYEQKSFWEEHPTITFTTLYEERTYEIISAFYDRVYYQAEKVFKFYRFIDPVDEADFENAMENYRKKALYDTGFTAEYGDHLITLVTCAAYMENGRFVVVAKQVDP